MVRKLGGREDRGVTQGACFNMRPECNQDLKELASAAVSPDVGQRSPGAHFECPAVAHGRKSFEISGWPLKTNTVLLLKSGLSRQI